MYNISIIVLNYNSTEDTISCVNKINSFAGGYHIIVVDNCSPDNSFDIIKKHFKGDHNVDVIKTGSNDGYSSGNNFGIKFAISKYNSEIVGIINPDVVLSNKDNIDVLAKILMSNEDYGIIGGRAVNYYGNDSLRYSAWDIPTNIGILVNLSNALRNRQFLTHIEKVSDNLVQVDCVAGCYFLAKTEAMKNVDFFDEGTFLYNEENILAIRMKRAGYKELIALDQKYLHNHKPEPKGRIPFQKAVSGSPVSYDSKKYMVKKYYSSLLLPLMWLVEQTNKVYGFARYIYRIIKYTRGAS